MVWIDWPMSSRRRRDEHDQRHRSPRRGADAVRGGCGSPCALEPAPRAIAVTRDRPAPKRATRSAPELYEALESEHLPEAAVLASLGCGNPTAVADLHAGETVLDLGSGGGIDVLLSAKRVGPTGKVYGLDMTEEMLALAIRNRDEAGATNVEFLKGTSRTSRSPRTPWTSSSRTA